MSAEPAPWIRLEGVHQQLGKVRALRNVTFSIHAGERVAVVGGNGSGKSTLLRVMHGLLVPQVGRVISDAALRQSFVFQRPFVMRASVQSNVALAAWLDGSPWSLAKAQARQALQVAGLQDLERRQARALSSGQQQRLAFARALVIKPDVLLLDEPTASLSPQGKQEVEALMHQCGATLVFASHNLGQVKRLASRVICLDAGEVVVDRSTDSFFNQPLPDAAQRFIQGQI